MALPTPRPKPIPLPLSQDDLSSLSKNPVNAQRLKQMLDYLMGYVTAASAKEHKEAGSVFPTGEGQTTPVIGAYGERQVPLAGRTVAVGMMVREFGGSIVPASNTDIGEFGPATAFVTSVDKDFAKIANGAASAPLLVTAPTVGDAVLLATNGYGTCDPAILTAVDPAALTQAVAVCESTKLDARGCVRCSSVSFGGAQIQPANPDGVYWRTDGTSSPSTGPWTLGGAGSGTPSLTISQTTTGRGNLWAHGTGLAANQDYVAMFGGGPDDGDYEGAMFFSLTGFDGANTTANLAAFSADLDGLCSMYIHFDTTSGHETTNFVSRSSVGGTDANRSYGVSAVAGVGYNGWSGTVNDSNGVTVGLDSINSSEEAWFQFRVAAGTTIERVGAKFDGNASANNGVTLILYSLDLMGTTAVWTELGNADLFSATIVTDYLDLTGSPIIVTSDTTYAVRVVSIVDDPSSARLYTVFLETSQLGMLGW